MVHTPEGDRASKPHIQGIPTDPAEIARREAANALLQFDAVVELVNSAVRDDTPFGLRLSVALNLNRIATEGTKAFLEKRPAKFTGQ